jgi:2-desacetyl-2-hydroxyethyl bacteriochlorophyllide A dehydrogenase
LSRTAPAIAFSRLGVVDVLEVEIPDPEPDEIRVQTVYSGVSQGTERWLLTGRHQGVDGQAAETYPLFPGYQAAGVVEAVGRDVTGIAVGDSVAVQGTRFVDPGLRPKSSGAASHVGLIVTKASAATKLPPGADLAEAALYKMVGVARHGTRLARIKEGDVVALIGLGLIGQMSAQAARRLGAHVIATDLIPSRVEAAAAHSADVAVNGSGSAFADALHEAAPDGADVVIDTTGSSRIFGHLVDLVRREGTIVMQGYYPDPIEVQFHPTHQKRATVVYPCGWDGPEADAVIAQDLGDHQLSIAPLITHRVPYSEAVSAYDLILNSPEQGLGMVFDWKDAPLG